MTERGQQRDPDRPLSIVPAAEAADRLPESFDDDLAWILSKYVERTGAGGGVLSVHYDDGRSPDLIFAYGPPTDEPDLAARLADAAAAARWQDRRGEEPVSIWGEVADGDGARATLSLPLAGHDGRRVVMTTLHPDLAPAPEGVGHAMALRLQPVLAGYFKLWLINRAQRRRMNAYASALDRTDIAILLLDGAGHLTFVNEAARGLLDEADGIRRVGRGIAATDATDAVRLRVALDHVMAIERTDGIVTPGAQSPVVSLRRRSDRRALIAAVLPVDQPPGCATDPIAILYVFTPDLDVGTLLRPVCQVYGLSPSETRLVGLLAEGLSVQEASESMRVKVPTLRTYLKQIFAKTGTARQGDLIRLMMTGLVRTRSDAGHRLI